MQNRWVPFFSAAPFRLAPHALKGQKLLAQGIRPGYLCPHAWRPERAKALYGAPNMINKPKKIGEKMM